MKKWIIEHKGFACFIVLQIVVLFFLVTRLFGGRIEMQFDASNLDITDEKAIISEDNTIYITGKNDEEPFGRWIAGTQQFDLKGGMYEVAVNYRSLLTDTQESADYENETGRLEVVREETADNFYYIPITFQDGDTFRVTRMWIRDDSGETGLQMKISFYGTGELEVEKIIISELVAWRFMRLFAWVIVFCMIDAAVLYFFFYENAKKKLTVAALAFTVFFVSLPMLTDSLFYGHDLYFHLTRIMALADSLSSGHIIETIQTETCNGYGYASPLFYGQLFLYLPAVLYNMAVPMQICYQIYVITVNIVTCLIAYYSFRGISKDDKIAVTGSVVYTLSIYRLTNQLVRAAVGEYTAMAFFPLAAYGFIRVYRKDEDKIILTDYLPIVLGLSGIIQSHVLSCELTALFIFVICIVNLKKTCSLKRFIAFVKAAVLTLFVNMGFLLPFLDSMRMDIQVKNDPINKMQVHGAYLIQVFAPFQLSFGGSIKGMQDEMPLALGMALFIGIAIFLVCCIMHKEWKVKKNVFFRTGVESAILTAVCIILTLKFFPWDSIEGVSKPLAKMLCIIQVPWRYLAPATIFATITTVIGLMIVKEIKGSKTVHMLCIVLCMTAIVTSGFYMDIFTNGIKLASAFGDADVHVEYGKNEYFPKDTDPKKFYDRTVSFDKNDIMVSDYLYENGVTTFLCQNTSDVEKPVEIPLLNYDNYHAYDTVTGKEIGIMNGTNNKVSLAVPPYFDGEIKVVYEIPLDWKIAYAVSLLSVILIVVMVVRNRRKERLS